MIKIIIRINIELPITSYHKYGHTNQAGHYHQNLKIQRVLHWLLPVEYFSARMATLTTISSFNADWAELRLDTNSPTTSSEFDSSTKTKMRSNARL